MNNQAIQNLNDKIANNYHVQIRVNQSLILDSYEEGEIEEVSFIKCLDEQTMQTTSEDISKRLQDCLSYIIEDLIEYGSLEKYFEECFNYSDDAIIILRSVTEGGRLPTEEEIELWRKGDFQLFNEYSHVNIKINGVSIGQDLTKEILNMEKHYEQ